jgi:hypothetical protein
MSGLALSSHAPVSHCRVCRPDRPRFALFDDRRALSRESVSNKGQNAAIAEKRILPWEATIQAMLVDGGGEQ